MQGDSQVIQHLNKILRNELTAISQYFLHARMFKNWGLMRLNQKVFHESIDEMKHADKLVERVLFLEGLPNLQDLGHLYIGEEPKEMIELDLRQEMEAVANLRKAIIYCESVKDYVSKDLLEQILEDEEGHIDWLETQLHLINEISIENYLQAQMVGEG